MASNGFWCPFTKKWSIFIDDGNGKAYSMKFDNPPPVGGRLDVSTMPLRMGEVVKVTGGTYHAYPDGSRQIFNHNLTYEKVAALILEQNKARSDPQKYAELYILPMLQYFNGLIYSAPGKMANITQEGAAAVNECIAALNSAAAVGILRPERGLSLAAKDHVADQGRTGGTGHNGSDGSTPDIRMMRYGAFTDQQWRGGGENIAYGPTTGRDIVICLLVDDGVPGRGHRTNLLNNVYTQTGVGFGPQSYYGRNCTINYATGYRSN